MAAINNNDTICGSLGERNKEPLSGASGDVSKGEPFDAGNMEPHDQERLSKSMSAKDRIPTDNDNENNNSGPAEKKSEEVTDEINYLHLLGQGPRPLDKVAEENGGGAANSTGNSSDSTGASTEGGSKEKGTGELYVRSTGLAAEGGSFDASQPGAGREADRLMEVKGMKPDGVAKDSTDLRDKTTGKIEKEKPSIIDRIKSKLHKN